MSRQPGAEPPPLVRLGTIVARNYVAQARVLWGSVAGVHPEIEFSTLLVDGTEADRGLEGLGRVLLPTDLRLDARQLDVMKTIYDVMEFSTSLKPSLLAFLLEEGADVAAYFDPDIFFYSRMDDLFARTLASGISLTPHTVNPFPTDDSLVSERMVMWAGIYNLGFVAVSAAASRVLDWWENRLTTHGISDPANAMFTDQRWMDWVPAIATPNIERGLGFNVAHWNLHERPITLTGSGPLAGGEPVRFVHFSGYDPAKPWLVSKHTAENPRVLLSENPDLKTLCDAYGVLLVESGHPQLRLEPYGLGELANGFRLSTELRRFLRLVLIGEVVGGVLPPSPYSDPARFEAWLHLRQFGSRLHPLTALELAYWHVRSDLRGTFADPLDSDAYAYALWFANDESATAWRDAMASRRYRGRSIDASPAAEPLPAGSWTVLSTAPAHDEKRMPALALADALTASGRPASVLDAGPYAAGDPVVPSPAAVLLASPGVQAVAAYTSDDLAAGGIGALADSASIAFVTGTPAQFGPAVLLELAGYDRVWAAGDWTAGWLAGLGRFVVRQVTLPVAPGSALASTARASAVPAFRIAVDAADPGWRTSLDDAVDAYQAALPTPGRTRLEVVDRGLPVEARERIGVLSATRPDIALVPADAPPGAGSVLLVLEPGQGHSASTATAVRSGVPVIAADHPGCTGLLPDDHDRVALRGPTALSPADADTLAWPGCDRAALAAALLAALDAPDEAAGQAERASAALAERGFDVLPVKELERPETLV